MAMGQGEQRAIHPFFRKDSGISTPRPQPVNDSLLRPTGFPESNSPASQTAPSVAALDHDPNTDRRKRRKIEKDVADLPGQFPNHDSESQTADSASSGPAITESRTQEPCGPEVTVEIPAASEERRPQQQLAEDARTPQVGHIASNDPDEKRKVIKLNPNGKLLSSPVGSKVVEPPKRRNPKRGKNSAVNAGARGRKLVVIKYGDKGESSESIGKLIDDILNGQSKPSAEPPNTSHPPQPPAPQQPGRATHPFFLKKATPKSNVPTTAISAQNITPPSENPQSGSTDTTHTRPITKPLSSFKHVFTKVPEPMQPLWPPLGLAHVRDVNYELGEHAESNYPFHMDVRKSKTPAISVNDEESILSSIVVAESDTAPILRIPEKQITSGRDLQATMAERLTGHLARAAANNIPSTEAFHPAIARLYASLLTSMTAFDRGEYDTQLWAHKYAPDSAQQVLCATKEAPMLRDWLKHLVVSCVETGNSSKESERTKRKEEKKRKRRKKSDKLDGFIISSDDEASEMGEISGSDDELAGDVTTVSNKRTVIRSGDLTVNVRSSNDRGRMTNAILLSGPSGCGKTASVYAVAREMGFEVFELNAGSRRSAKDILDRIGDMTQNHLVHNLHSSGNHSGSPVSAAEPQAVGSEDAKQNKLMGFFKSTSGGSRRPGRPTAKASEKETDMKQARNQKQSLILLEEADILFEEDKQFWSGVLTLIRQSKRPIVITCNDESLIPLDDISFHAILRYRAPPQDLAVDYLLLVAANEGHVLQRTGIEKLYLSVGHDLRKSIMELNYWCQLTVGSEKSGLDWMIDRWPRGADLDSNGDKLRVLSVDTYRDYMGWFSRDILMTESLATERELQAEALHWWQLSLQDASSMEDSEHHPLAEPSQGGSKREHLDNLRFYSEFMESRSVFDVLSAACSLDARNDAVDTSIPPIMPEKQKLNYVEGYQLLSANHTPDYTSLIPEIGCTFEVLLEKSFRKPRETDLETSLARKIMKDRARPKAVHPQGIELSEALVSVMRPDCAVSPSNARVDLAFEHGLRSIVEDITPYVRGILTFDLRLEQYRRELSRLLSVNGRGAKRVRTTRSSRAALEGGTKAETRKERWFSPGVNVPRVLATGKKEWQELLVQGGYFTVPTPGEQQIREVSEPASEGASEGSI
ncbi:hypothetical protein BJX61DRAFT_493518 [Aspergillus egyptiacus]|nr:hypothetical protein BJX61DRAFT_493518 [Aspergillus egyptiacus]